MNNSDIKAFIQENNLEKLYLIDDFSIDQLLFLISNCKERKNPEIYHKTSAQIIKKIKEIPLLRLHRYYNDNDKLLIAAIEQEIRDRKIDMTNYLDWIPFVSDENKVNNLIINKFLNFYNQNYKKILINWTKKDLSLEYRKLVIDSIKKRGITPEEVSVILNSCDNQSNLFVMLANNNSSTIFTNQKIK